MVTQMSSHVTLLVGYTFPGRNPVLWYRGKVNADNQGRYEFKATFPRRYEGRPIIHYHYKVSWERTMKSKNFSLCLSHFFLKRWLQREESSSPKHISREGSLQVTRTMSREEKANSQRYKPTGAEEGSPSMCGSVSKFWKLECWNAILCLGFWFDRWSVYER